MSNYRILFATMGIIALMGLGIVWKWNTLPSSNRHAPSMDALPPPDPPHNRTKLRIHWLLSQPTQMIGEIQNLTDTPLSNLHIKAFSPAGDRVFEAWPDGKLPQSPITNVRGSDTLQPGEWAKFSAVGSEYCSFMVYTLSRDNAGQPIQEEISYEEDYQPHQSSYAAHNLH